MAGGGRVGVEEGAGRLAPVGPVGKWEEEGRGELDMGIFQEFCLFFFVFFAGCCRSDLPLEWLKTGEGG